MINVALGRSVLQSALFALAIAVGLTPQLLPAIVTVSLATGARRLARRRVIVKRLVCIEDLGNVEVLFTDKTGTLTEGRISFTRPLDCLGRPDDRVRALGLACSDKAGNELDRALWAAARGSAEDGGGWPIARQPAVRPRAAARLRPRRRAGRAAADRQGRPRSRPRPLRRRCPPRPRRPSTACSPRARASSPSRAARSRSSVSATTTSATSRSTASSASPTRPSPTSSESLARLDRLGVTVKIVTGDNGQVAAHLCREVGLDPGTVLTGSRARRDGRRRPARAAAADDGLRARDARSRSRASSSPSAASARTSASSATASTTRSPSTTPTSASPSTPPPTSPRTPQTSSCSTRTSGSSPTVSSRAGGSSPTRSSTC